MSGLTPVRVLVMPMSTGARQIVLACPCVKVGRIATRWEPMSEVVEQLLVDHHRAAPLCRHPQPVGVMRP
jgi:hypothetical protein